MRNGITWALGFLLWGAATGADAGGAFTREIRKKDAYVLVSKDGQTHLHFAAR